MSVTCCKLELLFLGVAGLLTATISSEVFQAAQPALLYLVPFTLLPLVTMAYLKVNRPVHDYTLTSTLKSLTDVLGHGCVNCF